uniref:Protein translocase subunit SecA n=1 Tax=Lygus hesperus TaxID=30085 RepID=A0A0A9W5F2_LYGHE
MTMTMNSYRQLLSSFDSVAQLYGNVTAHFTPKVRDPINSFRDGMRDLKDKGPFNELNKELHSTTLAVLTPIKSELKKVQASVDNYKEKRKNYDNVRYKLEQLEKKYAKNTKPVSEDKSYQKYLVRRDKCKVEYERSKAIVERDVTVLKANSENAFLASMNYYLHSSAKFCNFLKNTMNHYRVNKDNSNLQSTSYITD